MKEQLIERLEKLKSEYDAGQKMLGELDRKRMNLQETLLRISGAIQVVEELIEETNGNNGQSAASLDASDRELPNQSPV